jgi:protein tyrosine phosphatase
MSHPSWLQSSLQQSNLIAVLQTLESRELSRKSARAARNTLPDNRQYPHGSRVPSTLREYYSCSVGQSPPYKRHNRYQALEPYDRTRVLVPTPARGQIDPEIQHIASNTENRRYLNANWVRELASGNWWIAGQAPLPNTIHAFLTLCMSPVTPPSTVSATSAPLPPMRRVHTIVQLTPLLEGGRRRAHPYFPLSPQQSITVNPELGCDAPPIHVYNDREEVISNAECVKTDLRLRWGDDDESVGGDQDEYKVTHLLYTAWPDFGVPKDNRSILRFAQLVERLNNRHLTHPTDDPNASPPILVHCSAGVGRTGSFIALSSLLRAHSLLSSPHPSSPPRPLVAPSLPVSPLGSLPPELDGDLIAAEIDALREQRQSMVERPEQVIWVYKALYDAFAES